MKLKLYHIYMVIPGSLEMGVNRSKSIIAYRWPGKLEGHLVTCSMVCRKIDDKSFDSAFSTDIKDIDLSAPGAILKRFLELVNKGYSFNMLRM